MEKPFQTLGIREIQLLNKTVIERFGGMYVHETGNFFNKNRLEHVLEVVLFPLFGEERYKTVFEKIAAISNIVIVGHVFNDGNKRTGLALWISLLEMNGYTFSPTKEDEDFLVSIADKHPPIEEIAAWLQNRSRKKIPGRNPVLRARIIPFS